MTLEERAALKRDILASLHCALPGTVLSFDASSGTASVRPALRARLTGSGQLISCPVLPVVPVFLPSFSDPDLTLTVHPGDPCLLIFSDIALDAWLAAGDAPLPPSGRQHDLSDAFALVGFRRP